MTGMTELTDATIDNYITVSKEVTDHWPCNAFHYITYYSTTTSLVYQKWRLRNEMFGSHCNCNWQRQCELPPH